MEADRNRYHDRQNEEKKSRPGDHHQGVQHPQHIPDDLFEMLVQSGIENVSESSRHLGQLNDLLEYSIASQSNGVTEVPYWDIKSPEVQKLIANKKFSEFLLNLLIQCGTPFDVGACQEKLELRCNLLNTFDLLFYVDQYGIFVVENCFSQVMGFFADNLVKAKEWIARIQ